MVSKRLIIIVNAIIVGALLLVLSELASSGPQFYYGVLYLLLTEEEEPSDFTLICRTRSHIGGIYASKFQSLKSGLHVIIAEVDGPIVKGFFTIPTEAQDNDGLPHALEHLVFLGSENYPYKGVLDLLANRCLAEGTNAWTTTDHTAFTVETAGKEGFLNLLPIYVEHLLYPTLTDADFTSEVYHITGEGEDAGVVYSEMMATENEGFQLAYRALNQMLYPPPSGYRYKPGGVLANLRNSTTNEKLRTYHQKLYHPENLYLIVVGKVESKEVFEALESIEDKIIEENKEKMEETEKPWKTEPPPFEASRDREIFYPSDSEDTGIVSVGWRGPSIVNNFNEFQSLKVLMDYLVDNSVSPLPKVFVEADDPLASTIHGYVQEFSISSSTLTFAGVPKDKIRQVKPLLMKTLRRLVSGEIPIDLQAMRDLIRNMILREENRLETSSHEMFAEKIILDVLYGHNCESLDRVINSVTWYEHLLTKPASYWMNLIHNHFIEPPMAFVTAIPSRAKVQQLQEEKKRRIMTRKAELGKEGLTYWKQKEAEAQKNNEISPPESILESIPVPSIKSINFHSLKVYTNINNIFWEKNSYPDPSLINIKDLPFKMQIDDVKSNFVQIIVLLDTHSLSSSARLYLPLLMELLMESTVQTEDHIIPYEKVIQGLNGDTLRAHTVKGIRLHNLMFSFGDYFHNVGLNVKTELAKYEQGIEWLRRILFRVVLEPSRVLIKINKLLNSISDMKNEGDIILRNMYNEMVFQNDTNINQASVLRQEEFLDGLRKTLEDNPRKVIKELTYVYRNITDLDHITIHMSTNLEKLAEFTNATKPWYTLIPQKDHTNYMNLNVINDWEQRLPFDPHENVTGYITGLGSIESSYLLQTTPSISSYLHPDLPALFTVISYLTQVEGPLWNQIRGNGLAYFYSITVKPERGMITLELDRASRLREAYDDAMAIIREHLNHEDAWNRLLFESARSSLMYMFVEREADISDVVRQSLLAYYRKVPHGFNRSLMEALEQVELEDLHPIAVKYLKPMIEPHLSRTFVVCPMSKVDEITDHLNHFGHTIEEIVR